MRSWQYEGIHCRVYRAIYCSEIGKSVRIGWLQYPSQGYEKYVSDRGAGECPFWLPDACLDSITPPVSPRGVRSSSSLSRVAGLIHLRGSLSRIRARLRSTTLRRARDLRRYRSLIPIYPFFLPSCPPPLRSWAPTASILRLILLFRSSPVHLIQVDILITISDKCPFNI